MDNLFVNLLSKCSISIYMETFSKISRIIVSSTLQPPPFRFYIPPTGVFPYPSPFTRCFNVFKLSKNEATNHSFHITASILTTGNFFGFVRKIKLHIVVVHKDFPTSFRKKRFYTQFVDFRPFPPPSFRIQVPLIDLPLYI